MNKGRLLAAGLLLCISSASFADTGSNIIRMRAPIAGAPKPAAQSFSLEAQALPSGQEGNAYTFDLNTLVTWSGAADETRPTLSWVATGLPSGLSLSNIGLISGVPLAGSNSTVLATAASSTKSKTGSYDLTVVATPVFTLTSQTLPSAKAGMAYTFDLNTLVSWSGDADATRPTLSWTATGLPAGLSVSSDGVISGTPSAGSTSTVLANAVSAAQTKTGSYPLTVSAPEFTLTSQTLPGAKAGTAYTFDLNTLVNWSGDANATRPTLSWTATGLPAGLSLSSSGVISGTPSAESASTVLVTAASSAQTKTGSYPLAVSAPDFTLTSQTLPSGEVGTAYTFDLNTLVTWSGAANATRPTLSWTATGLPTGLSVSSGGVISGTPSAGSTSTVVATAASSAQSKSGSYPLTVAATSNLMCKDILAKNSSSASGVYSLRLNGTAISAYCEMTADGGGWTLVGRGAAGNPGNWAKTASDVGLGSTLSPTTTFSFKYADATINQMPKTAFKVITTGGYQNTRYFKGTCVYNQMVNATGDCAISYATSTWTSARGNGAAGAGGLSDHRTSVSNDGYFIATSLPALPSYGWAAGNGTTGSNTATGTAGTTVGETLWIK